MPKTILEDIEIWSLRMPERLGQHSRLEWRARQHMLDFADGDPKALCRFDSVALVESSELEACLTHDASLW